MPKPVPILGKFDRIDEIDKADKNRRLLQWLIILFTVLAGGFLLLHFAFGTSPQATKAAKVGFVATSAIFITAVFISAIALAFFTKKTCGPQILLNGAKI